MKKLKPLCGLLAAMLIILCLNACSSPDEDIDTGSETEIGSDTGGDNPGDGTEPAGGAYAALNNPVSQITLQFAESHTAMSFNWITAEAISKTVIVYEKKSVYEKRVAEGSATPFGYRNDGGVSYQIPGTNLWSHKISITGLEYDTEYVYSVGDDGSDTPVLESFKTRPANVDKFTFVAFADPQLASATETNFINIDASFTGHMKKHNIKPAFYVVAGDLVEDDKSDMWPVYFGAAKSTMMKYPFMTAVGNNDWRGVSFRNYLDRYNNPQNGPTTSTYAGLNPKVEGTVYSFEYGDAFFAVLNSEIDLALQMKWLKDAASQSTKKWRIVMMHRNPFYAIKDVGSLWSTTSQTFNELGIDLVLAGHDHQYSRVNYHKTSSNANNTDSGKGYGTEYFKSDSNLAGLVERKTIDGKQVPCFNANNVAAYLTLSTAGANRGATPADFYTRFPWVDYADLADNIVPEHKTLTSGYGVIINVTSGYIECVMMTCAFLVKDSAPVEASRFRLEK